jgi:hypothetical protein
MKKVVAIVIVLVTVIALAVPPAHASAAASAALALGAFAAFNVLFLGPLWAATWYPPVYAAPAPVVYAPPVYRPAPARYYPSPAPLINREVVYPHGRYVLYGDGVRTAYQWVWVPTPPPPPAGPPTQ